MEENVSIGSRFENIIKEKRLTVRKLAILLEVHPQTIADIISGKTRSPRTELTSKMSEKLDINFEYIIGISDDMHKKTVQEQPIEYNVDYKLKYEQVLEENEKLKQRVKDLEVGIEMAREAIAAHKKK